MRKKIIRNAQMAIWQDAPIDRSVECAVNEAWDHQQNIIDEQDKLLQEARELLSRSRARSNYPTAEWNKERDEFLKKLKKE